MEAEGAAAVLEEDGLTGQRLGQLVTSLVADGSRLTDMGLAARHLGRPDAARRVADLLTGEEERV